MSSNSQNAILDAFNQAAGSTASATAPSGALDPLSSSSVQGLQDALTQATQVINAEAQATTANTDALAQNTQAKSAGSGSGGVTDVMNTVGSLLGGGLSLMPIVSLFTSLFGGGQSQEPAPLTPYSLPASLNLETTSNYQNVVWGDNDLPRPEGAPATGPGSGGQATAPGLGGAAPQITVQVQAIDSQSFLDHSDEIAQAVRRAMLNMNSLNDVVTDL